MAQLYFSPVVNGDWAELGNWFVDDTQMTPATALPTNEDNVIIDSNYETTNSGDAVTVASLVAYGSGFLSFDLTVTGNATFNDSSSNDYGTVTGDAVFNDGSYNYGTVTGNAVFNDSSRTYGTVTGDAVFNDSSSNDNGTVTGNATFNDNSYNNGTVMGDAAFNDGSYNQYGINGTVTLAYDRGINGSSILGVV